MNRPTPLPGRPRGDYGREQAERDRELNKEARRSQDDNREKFDIMLHDNSVDGFRGWEQGGMLFVEEEPHRIRPVDETGVKIDQETWHWNLSVNDPTQRDEYALDSLRVMTGHSLCVVCKDTLNYYCRYIDERNEWDSDMLFPMKNSVVHHGSLWPLHVFANIVEPYCIICADIWDKIDATYPNLIKDFYFNYQIECCWPRRPRRTEEHKMWFFMVNPSKEKDPLWNWQPVLRLSLWPKAQFGHHFEHQQRNIQTRGPWDACADDNTNDAMSTRSRALDWLARCQENANGQHNLCNAQGEFVPTRLLDVRKALQTGRVCLTLTEALDSCEYVTLSHCWGSWGAENNPVLLTDNLAARQTDGLAWDALPQTFQDAFKVASWFGWDWLWIDSLCIIQDSEDDWKREAAMMDRVYQNAQINISADAGDDSRVGCFSPRNEDDIKPLELSSGEDGPWQVTTDNSFAWMKSATSLSRAWIHRERQLSRRILHLTNQELVWECCGLGNTGFASETMPGGAPFERVFGGDIKFQIKLSEAGGSGDKERLDRIYQLWNSTCEGLSKKSVTFAADLPIILSSLAKEVHRMIPDDEYVCGLWKSTLPESLNWWTPHDRPDNLIFVAPSWSWLNVAVPVHMATHNQAQHNLPVAEVLDVVADLDSDPYGAVTKGDLHMRGFLRRVHFHFIERSRFVLSVIEEENGEDRIRLIGPDWNQEDGQVCQLTIDGLVRLENQEHECYAFFTTIAERGQDLQSCTRNLSCLLLDAVDGKDNTYSRFGSINNLCDEFSFSLRYTVIGGAELGVSRQSYVPIDYWGPDAVEQPVTKQTIPSIWDLMARFIRRHRWGLMLWKKMLEDEAKRLERGSGDVEKGSKGDSQDGSKQEPEEEPIGGSQHESEEEFTQVQPPASTDNDSSHSAVADSQAGFEDPRQSSYRSLINQIRRHPSSCLAPLDDESQMVEDAASIMPTVEPFGTRLPPAEALYQFDEVLDEWRDEQGVVPWLKRLDLVEIVLV